MTTGRRWAQNNPDRGNCDLRFCVAIRRNYRHLYIEEHSADRGSYDRLSWFDGHPAIHGLSRLAIGPVEIGALGAASAALVVSPGAAGVIAVVSALLGWVAARRPCQLTVTSGDSDPITHVRDGRRVADMKDLPERLEGRRKPDV
jgi:hypothetical protein